MRRSHRSVWMVVLGGALVTTTGCSTVRVHPAFQERQPSIHVVAALPPEVTVYRLTFKGDRELMHELIPPVAETIITTVEATFTAKGYKVPHLNPNDPELTQNAELRGAIFQAQQVFDKRLEEISRRGLRQPFTYTLGPEVNRFADMSRSDALLLSRCEGMKKSGGEIAKDVAKTLLIAVASLGHVFVAYPSSITVVQLAIVDGDTGDILWYHSNIDDQQVAFDVANARQLANVVKGLLEPFPKAVVLARAMAPRSSAVSSTATASPPAQLPVATR